MLRRGLLSTCTLMLTNQNPKEYYEKDKLVHSFIDHHCHHLGLSAGARSRTENIAGRCIGFVY